VHRIPQPPPAFARVGLCQECAVRPTHPKRSATKPNAPAIVADPLAKVVRVPLAARMMAMSERTVWNLIAAGRLAVTRVNGITLVRVESIDALLDGPSAAPREVPRRSTEAQRPGEPEPRASRETAATVQS
jgi:hypothetical protein